MTVTAMDARVVRMSAVLAALTGAAAGGCGPSNGSDSAPPSCLQVQPCGGDVVGTWRFLGACIGSRAPPEREYDSLQAVVPGSLDQRGGRRSSRAPSRTTPIRPIRLTRSKRSPVMETLPLSCLAASPAARRRCRAARTARSRARARRTAPAARRDRLPRTRRARSTDQRCRLDHGRSDVERGRRVLRRERRSFTSSASTRRPAH